MTAWRSVGRLIGRFPFAPLSAWLISLRVLLGAYMVAHGGWRAWVGTVDNFGAFLSARGFPAGLVLAWIITVWEIAGGSLFVAGRRVRAIAAAFALEHGAGIWLVHAPRGWFTVGHQVGGAEYSVLLLTCFLVIAAAAEDNTVKTGLSR